MTEMSNEAEVTLVAVGAASGAVAVYLGTQPIPIEIKTPIVVILGAISVGIGAWWAAKVNMKKQPA